MAKYLIKAVYTSAGAQGLLQDGGSKREAAARTVIESVGGKMDAFYFAFGETDAYVIVDAADHAAVTAACLTINATGAVTCTTTVLMTPKEVDAATGKSVQYRAPGS